MGYSRAPQTKKEQGFLLLGLILGGLLGFIGNFIVSSYFLYFKPSDFENGIMFFISIIGFISIIIWLVLMAREKLK